MTLKRKKHCTFCKRDFPENYQVISSKPKYWLFILSRGPQTDFHSLIVFKADIGHISELSDRSLPEEALIELGILLRRACVSIKKVDRGIDKILMVSLNAGKGSKHLHFHLIPKRTGELITMVNNPREDGGGMFFIGRKEIVVDTFSDFLEQTTGNESRELIKKVKKATKRKIRNNAQQLRAEFKKVWGNG
jgi:diadenosine tetraphosphate (Ap4A) HIT family hydrolase